MSALGPRDGRQLGQPEQIRIPAIRLGPQNRGIGGPGEEETAVFFQGADRIRGEQGALVSDDTAILHRVGGDLSADHPFAGKRGIQVATGQHEPGEGAAVEDRLGAVRTVNLFELAGGLQNQAQRNLELANRGGVGGEIGQGSVAELIGAGRGNRGRGNRDGLYLHETSCIPEI